MPNGETQKNTEKKSETLGSEIKQFYWDKELEKWVATEEFLMWRGYCCHTGCRHCPYKERCQ